MPGQGDRPVRRGDRRGAGERRRRRDGRDHRPGAEDRVVAGGRRRRRVLAPERDSRPARRGMEAGPRVPPRGAARHRGSAAQRDEDRSYHRVFDGRPHSHGRAQRYRVVVGRAAVADAGRDPGRPASRHHAGRRAGAVPAGPVRFAAGADASGGRLAQAAAGHDGAQGHDGTQRYDGAPGDPGSGSPAGTRRRRGPRRASGHIRRPRRYCPRPPAPEPAARALRPTRRPDCEVVDAGCEIPRARARGDQLERRRHRRPRGRRDSRAETRATRHHQGQEAVTDPRDPRDPRRRLPAVDAVLAEPDVAALVTAHPRGLVVRAVRDTIEHARANGGAAPAEGWGAAVRARVQRLAAPSLLPVINATGVVLHTNLGRAPLARAARDAMARIAAGYSNLEYDLAQGTRGSRHALCRDLLVELTGAEDAIVVNNAAGALLVALSALARNGEAIVSRGELVEIGGAFRIPDIMARSGATLVEVGTTNRTHLRD